LHEIQSWADGTDERCVFWLSGLAGTGKSTIARTIARRYNDRQCLAASFFFSRGGGEVGHAGKFVTSIALQLARNVPALKQRISDAVVERDDIASQSLRDQWHHLVLGPLSKLNDRDCQASLVLVVDALDECDSNDNIRIIVQLLAEAPSPTRVRLRVLLTSRPEVPIRHGFYEMPDSKHQDVVLHNISRSIVNHDIALFLQHNLQLIARECYLDAGWPGVEIITQLTQSASGLFIWAATACRFIREGLFADERLRILLAGSVSINPIGPEEQLTKMYVTVLQTSIRHGYNAQEMIVYYSILRLILGSIVVLTSPLPVGSVSALLRVPKHKVDQMLKDLHAILDIPDDQSRPIRLHHPSFRDFLLDKARCGDNSFWVDERSTHEKLASCCLELMSGQSGLRRNMCSLVGPGALRSEIDDGAVASSLLLELQYACRYWITHLVQSQQHIIDKDTTHLFLQKHFLHWLEAMSLMRESSRCVHLLNSLQALAGVGSILNLSYAVLTCKIAICKHYSKLST
jgi:hypothetical protein